MFAAPVVKPQAKSDPQSTGKSPEAVSGHEGDIEPAPTSRGATWDFSTIPLYPPSRLPAPEHPSPPPVPRLPGPIQKKLNLGAVQDPLESEADRVADQVMRMPAREVTVGIAQPQISRQSDAGGTQAAIGDVPSSVHDVLRSPGEPLDPATRAFFEPRFKHDFSSVRVHADEKAAQSARSIHAHAYTAGDNIVFGEGQFAPATEGRRLLAHELTHVVQQGGSARTVQRAPIVAAAPKAISSSFNSYVDLFNGFQDLAAAAINRHGAGLDTTRFGGDLGASHRRLLWRVRTVLIQAQVQDKDQRLAAAAAWPDLAAKLLAAVAEAARLQFPGHVLAAVTDDIAMLGRNYVHARAGNAEPELESYEDYAEAVHGMNDLLWIFGQMGETGGGLIREQVPNRKEAEVSLAVLEVNARQRTALSKVQLGSHLNARHAKVLNTLRAALLLARSEAPGSAYKALTLWRSIHGDLQHVLDRAPVYQVQFDVKGIQREVDSAAQVLANHYAAVHQENVEVALTKPRAPEQVKAERAIAKAGGLIVAAGMHEARAVEDFGYALTIIENHITPSAGQPGEWTLTSGNTVIRVRADQVQSLRDTVARELKTYMAQLVKAMVRVWETYDSIQRGNSTFKLAVLGGWGGATDPGDQADFKNSLIRVRDQKVYPLVDQGKYVEAFKWIMIQKGVVDRQAKEVGDYDSDLDLGYSRLATAMTVVQVALVSLVPVAGEAALAGGAGVWAVGGTAVAAGSGGAAYAETWRQLASGEDLDPGKIGKAAWSGAVIGTSAVGPAATKGLSKLIAPVQEGTAVVGANAAAAGTVGAIQSKLGGGSGLEGFAGGYFGSFAGSLTSQALGSIAENPAARTVIAGGIGAGTGWVTGDPLAGFVGGISGSLVPHTGASRTSRPTEVSEPPVGGATTHATGGSPSQSTTPAIAESAGPTHTPAQAPALAGSQMVPLRSTYTPPSEEVVVRGPSRARPFYAKDPKARPGLRQPSAKGQRPKAGWKSGFKDADIAEVHGELAPVISGGIVEAVDSDVAHAFGISVSEEPLVTGPDLPVAGEGRREAGNAFNQIARFQYPHNEIPIRTRAGGLVWLDSYNPVTREIVSRKFTQLAEVGYETGLDYLQEARVKYPSGALIAETPAAGPLAGQRVTGNLILEVPIQNAPVPPELVQYARSRGIQIRDVAGTVWN